MFKYAMLKLATMRKYQEFSVQPSSDNMIVIQSDKAIGRFDIKTGIGRLNTKGCYFSHLAIATPYTLTPEQLSECLKVCPALNGETKIGGFILNNTIQVF